MTIHSSHPFRDPNDNPLKRLRGRLVAPVSVWCAGEGPSRSGWTVSSLMLADGDEPRLLGLIDPDEDIAEMVSPPGTRFTVNVLSQDQALVAEVFAQLAPSPGGVFQTGEWTTSEWGPELANSAAIIRATSETATKVGYRLLITARIDSIENFSPDALLHYRGRYSTWFSGPAV